MQEEVQNQDSESLSPSSSSLVIQLVTENVITPEDITLGSIAIDPHMKDLVEGFWRFQLKWINTTVKEVHFSLLPANL
jgi:hypothetical protein